MSELMIEKGPIWKLDDNDTDIPLNESTNGASNGVKNVTHNVPSIKDVIGASLRYVGAYKQLDNTKQVVALIDDVIFSFHTTF